MELNLQNKTALVLGNSKGIGLAITNELRKEGIKVPNISRSMGYNLMNELDRNKLYNDYKAIDILICNIGGMGSCDLVDYIEVMKKNYFINIECILNYLPFMEKNNWGRVIFISSIFGKEKGHNPIFVASKAAQIGFIKSMSSKYKEITFNSVCPGHIDVGKPFPYTPKILGKPEDIAGIVTFLCSDYAKHINGTTITVDGGESASF